MTARLEGTVALVTGASSGIGEATAVALAAEGAKVAVAARRRDRIDDEFSNLNAQLIELVVTEPLEIGGAIY